VSNSNVIDLRKVFEKKPPLGEPRKCFASTRETIELLQAFSRIESPFLRGDGARGCYHYRTDRAAEEYGLVAV
jgi:hypothetical protein